tara:strand:+ start:6370 stop:6789 length:420 start_codon:yes stop_codon:yes gene_type:complete
MNIINEKIINKFNFIKTNFIYILLIITFFIGIMVISSILNKDDRKKTNPLNVTILEEFAVDKCSPDKSLEEMDEWCSSLRNSTCKLNGCCNLLSGSNIEEKCVGGSDQGPTFSQDFEYYTYKSECYDKYGQKVGKECPK